MEDAVSEFKTWYFAKPLVTRSYLSVCVLMTLLITLGIVSPKLLYYTFGQTFFELNLWRPFTALFYMGKFDFGFIFSCYFAYIALMKVETMIFSRERYADFLWFLILVFFGCLIVGSIINIFFFTQAFLMANIYLWCKRLPHEEITFMFGWRVKTGYFPFVYAIANLLFGASLIPYGVGILLGHCYVFVKDIALIIFPRLAGSQTGGTTDKEENLADRQLLASLQDREFDLIDFHVPTNTVNSVPQSFLINGVSFFSYLF